MKIRLSLILKSKLNGKNKVQAINTWVVARLRYGAGIVNWKIDELKKWIEQRERLCQCTRSFIQRVTLIELYLKQKHGGRGLICIEMCVSLEENNLGLYVSG